MKKYNLKLATVFSILLSIVLAVSAQQPRLPQVKEYLERTGEVTENRMQNNRKQYCLLQQDYHANSQLMLDVPVFKEKGVRAVMPFGFKLSPLSEVPLESTETNLFCSERIPLHNNRFFTDISYQFCDSVVYGIILQLSETSQKDMGTFEKEIASIFSKPDYSNDNETVYSDQDYAIQLDKKNSIIKMYSLFHYPIVEDFYPGVSQKVYYGPFHFKVDDNQQITLAFLNQESKENNIQTAFRIFYNGITPFELKTIHFKLDNGKELSYPLETEFLDKTNNRICEHDTRTFISPEDLQQLARTYRITVTLEGKNSKLSYDMPWFQHASLQTAYEYFRWHVTNPMAKYRAW